MQPNLQLLQSSIKDLKDIIESSHGGNAELCQLVKQMESVVADIETKTRNKKVVSQPPVLPMTNVLPGATLV